MDIDSERVTALHNADPNLRGDFVLYWMQIERRSETNDALDFAVNQANRRNLPVLVYEGRRRDDRNACDRFDAFLPENSRELRKRLHEKGIGGTQVTAGAADSGIMTRLDDTYALDGRDPNSAAIDTLRRRCDPAAGGV